MTEKLKYELNMDQESLELLVKERTKLLQDTNTELEEYAYSVSHDLRAPLRAMQSFAQILLDDYAENLDDLGKEYVNRIVTASQKLNSLIEDLLAYSCISKEEIDFNPIDLNEIINDILNQLVVKIKEKKANVTIKGSLPEVMAHYPTLNVVISNLLVNAITFVEPNIKPQIKIWSESFDDYVRIYIEDNGIGIEPEYYDKIFKIFERLHGTETYPGTGIGLALVKKGVERMDGHLGLESYIGKGSRFWIELHKVE